VPGGQLGFTLPHEHLVFDGTSIFAPPAAASDRGMAFRPVGWDTLSWLRYHPYENLDNVRMLDEGEASAELALFRQAGGMTLVDVTVPGIGRDPAALARLSRATGVHIVMGTGFYTEPSLAPEYREMSVDAMAQALIRDVAEGVGATGIRAGIIGEIACNWPPAATELKAVRAAALAQQETGAAISLHPGRNREAPFHLARLLRESGADLSRVIFCHTDARLRSPDDQLQLPMRDACSSSTSGAGRGTSHRTGRRTSTWTCRMTPTGSRRYARSRLAVTSPRCSSRTTSAFAAVAYAGEVGATATSRPMSCP